VWRYAPGWHGWLARVSPGTGAAQVAAGLRVGDFFPSCRLVWLRAKQDAAYLGMPAAAGSLALRQVPADYLLVELFNEYCQLCQKETPVYNQLFKRIQDDLRLARRMKIIGLGVGSSNRQVAKFRRQRGVLFPLFADHRREVFDCLGQPELPVLYLLKRHGHAGFRLVFQHTGHLSDLARFIDTLVKLVTRP